MPYGGLGSFLLIDYEYSNMNIQLVSMPYFGLLSFLHHPQPIIKELLCRLFQCPTSGFFLFYSMSLCDEIKLNGCFNALLRASFFSTIYDSIIFWKIRSVSMPYFGLLSFLQDRCITSSAMQLLVSMPYFGLLSFLHNERNHEQQGNREFQCPTSGFFLFYRCEITLSNSTASEGFNALLRASFFST